MTRLAFAALLATAALANPLLAQEDRQVLGPRTAADPGLPYSEGVQVGNTLYLAGKIGLTPDLQVPDTVEEEARLVLEDLKATLEAAEMTMDDLVSVQVFCSDVSHYDAFNRVYRTYFTREFPARAFIGAGTLLFGARFEIQAIAVRR